MYFCYPTLPGVYSSDLFSLLPTTLKIHHVSCSLSGSPRALDTYCLVLPRHDLLLPPSDSLSGFRTECLYVCGCTSSKTRRDLIRVTCKGTVVPKGKRTGSDPRSSPPVRVNCLSDKETSGGRNVAKEEESFFRLTI